MAAAGEAVCVDGLATRVQRPAGWANQKVLYDAKRHAHTAQGVAVSTIHGDLLWVDGGWPGGGPEHELLELSGLHQVLDDVEWSACWIGVPRAGQGARQHWHCRSGTAGPRTGSARGSGVQPPPGWAARAGGAGDLAGAWALRGWQGLLYRVRDVCLAAAGLVCLGQWLYRVPT
jgi:hypothetical protein